MAENGNDITDAVVPIKVRNFWYAIVGAALFTAAAVTGWLSLSYSVARAMERADLAIAETAAVKADVKVIKCLMSQQTQYQIYKQIPTRPCE